jgi:hypothetical protein
MLIPLERQPNRAAVEQEFPNHDPSHASPGARAMSLVWRDGRAASAVCLQLIERIHP